MNVFRQRIYFFSSVMRLNNSNEKYLKTI